MFYAVEHDDFVVFCCRTPHGVRGLKSEDWEIEECEEGRTPHGVRGLKSQKWRNKYNKYLEGLK